MLLIIHGSLSVTVVMPIMWLQFVFDRGQKGQSSLREILQPLVKGVMEDKNLNINTNPVEVYKQWINQTETETGEAR